MMKRLLFLLIAVCLLIPISLTNSSIVQAQEIKESISVTQMGEMNNTISSPPVCDWSAENHSTTYELIKPHCGPGGIVWAGIRSRATHTNSTKSVHNYRATGGNNAALSEFNKMPGTRSIF